MAQTMKFETALAKLEEIVRKLEGGNLNLDESLKSFEEGIKLARLCEKMLQEAKGRVEQLIKKEPGKWEEAPLEGQ